MRKSRFLLLGVLIVLPACGASTPAAPTPSPSPVVVATPTPTPVPATTPAPTPTPEEGEPPVTNTNPAKRLTMRIFVIENPDGTYTGNVDPNQPIPVGYTARLDVTAKDLDNRETVGQGEVQFFFSDPFLARVSGNHTNQRRVQGLAIGSLECWAVQDGVTSNTITLTFVP
jgi:hypothetical protein